MDEPVSARLAMLGPGACSCGADSTIIQHHEPACPVAACPRCGSKPAAEEQCDNCGHGYDIGASFLRLGPKKDAS